VTDRQTRAAESIIFTAIEFERCRRCPDSRCPSLTATWPFGVSPWTT
jgi:hypothetical protein